MAGSDHCDPEINPVRCRGISNHLKRGGGCFNTADKPTAAAIASTNKRESHAFLYAALQRAAATESSTQCFFHECADLRLLGRGQLL